MRWFRKRAPEPLAPSPGPREPRGWSSVEHLPAPEVPRRVSLKGFLWARIEELEGVDPDGAEQCRRVIDDCSARVSLTWPFGDPPRYVRGEITDWPPLQQLARNWADHPDFRPEWGEV